jgi:hypothetical protein
MTDLDTPAAPAVLHLMAGRIRAAAVTGHRVDAAQGRRVTWRSCSG